MEPIFIVIVAGITISLISLILAPGNTTPRMNDGNFIVHLVESYHLNVICLGELGWMVGREGSESVIQTDLGDAVNLCVERIEESHVQQAPRSS